LICFSRFSRGVAFFFFVFLTGVVVGGGAVGVVFCGSFLCGCSSDFEEVGAGNGKNLFNCYSDLFFLPFLG
jgi:hypothetical protein